MTGRLEISDLTQRQAWELVPFPDGSHQGVIVMDLLSAMGIPKKVGKGSLSVVYPSLLFEQLTTDLDRYDCLHLYVAKGQQTLRYHLVGKSNCQDSTKFSASQALADNNKLYSLFLAHALPDFGEENDPVESEQNQVAGEASQDLEGTDLRFSLSIEVNPGVVKLALPDDNFGQARLAGEARLVGLFFARESIIRETNDSGEVIFREEGQVGFLTLPQRATR